MLGTRQEKDITELSLMQLKAAIQSDFPIIANMFYETKNSEICKQ